MEIGESQNIAKGEVTAKSVHLGEHLVWPLTSENYTIKVKIEGERQKLFYLNILLGYNQQVDIDWGDGTIQTFASYNKNPTKRYELGEYIISVSGQFQYIGKHNLSLAASDNAYREVLSWGSHKILGIGYAFYGCTNLLYVADDYRNALQNITVADRAFYNCTNLKSIGSLLKNCPDLISIQEMCLYCANLVTFDTSNFQNSKNLVTFSGAFRNCPKLESRTPIGPDGVELWERINRPDLGYNSLGGDYYYVNTFALSTKIANYQDIPNDWKGV